MERRTTIIISVLVAVALLLLVVEYSFVKEQEEKGEEVEGGFFYTYFTKNLFGVTGEPRDETPPVQTNTTAPPNVSTTTGNGGVLGRITSALRRRSTETTIAPEGAITPEGEFDPEAFKSLVENQTGVPSAPVSVDIGNGTSVILAIPETILQGLRELGLEDEFSRFLNISLGEELNRVFGVALDYAQRSVPYLERGVVWVGNQTAGVLSSGVSFLFSLFLSFIPVAVEFASQGVVVAVSLTAEGIAGLISLTTTIFSEVLRVAPEVVSSSIEAVMESLRPALDSLMEAGETILNSLVESGVGAISSVFPSMTSSLSKSLPSLGGTGLGSQLANTITSTLGGVDAVTFG